MILSNGLGVGLQLSSAGAVVDKLDLDQYMPWLLMGGAGVLGRLMYHAKQVQAGKRKPFSVVLIWDLPIALCTGWMAFGLAKWIGLSWEPTVSMGMMLAYLGPYGIDTLFAKWSDLKFGGKKDAEQL